ncbi:threonine/serine exporter family protein [Akkermansia sp. N21116]|jgi:uncharacterized membrane protein YjjP (DUF1212 family)|uniref:threonine/serine ThrE exporter family protein n=1 Tax=Akkermansia sp. N21116 TaxID=3040764 RepID=UPI00244EA116|nr:threonine/serine exporter family protein [Akkermansia sp. N21116]WPX39590.1 threonine/serine exporter family protein [Akkermansia sp. N21116]
MTQELPSDSQIQSQVPRSDTGEGRDPDCVGHSGGKKRTSFQISADALLHYAVMMMAAGAHTSRVVRNTSRIAESFGYSVAITILQKSVMMSVKRKEDHSIRQTLIKKIEPAPINFRTISLLSTLSWEVHDCHLSVNEFRRKYRKIVAIPSMSRWMVLMLVALANASFCRLFQGDLIAMVVVFAATLSGFFVRQEMMKRHVNHYIVFTVCSCVASLIGGLAVFFQWGTTPSVAMATSVLFLVPGVPLINGIMDLLQGFVLMGISRLVGACNLIICIALGLAISLYIYGVNML